MISDETRGKWKTKVQTIIGAFDEGQCEMNQWEIDFLENIHNRIIYQRQDLTWKQSQTLNKIYGKVE